MRHRSTVASLLALAFFAAHAHAQVSLTGGTYTQDFDTLSNVAGSTTNTALPSGWLLNETGGGARDNEQYAVDTGASNTGDSYSYGAAGATERAFGSLRSGTLVAAYGACFTNNTGATLSSVQIAYTGEQWRLGTAARTDRLDFEYSLDANSLTSGSWVAVDALDFTTPNTVTTGAKDGNAAGNRTSLSQAISGLSIANGAGFCLRWSDSDAASADDGLAIDDVSITAGSATPALSINDVTLAEGDSGTTTANFTVSLSIPAGPGGVSFDVATGDGTATAGSDYVALALAGQTIPAGSSTATVAVTVNGDTTVEGNEAFFVNVTNVVGATVIDGQGVGTITNDDAAASPSLTLADVSVFEGNSGTSTARFTVSLSTPAPGGGVTFDIATSDGTATAGSDYLARALTGQSIAVGQSSAIFDVTINGDSTLEPDETFTVSVANVTGATVVDGSATGTIRNDDVALTAIHAVQGAGAQSPLVGSDVTVEGIVTARKFNNGFFLQTADGEADADPTTSQGLFVFTSSAPPAAAAVGNRVRVFGRVTEFVPTSTETRQLPLTQLAGATGVTLTVEAISTGNPLPTPVVLQAADLAPGNARDAMERYEGMRVAAALVTVAPTNANINEPNATATTGNGVFFATLAGVPRPLREPGLDPDEIVAQSAPGSIPRFDNNAEMLRVDSDGQIGAARVSVDAGTTIGTLVGVVDYAFAYYSLLPDAGQLAADATAGIPATGRAPTAVAAAGNDEITIGGFNLLRFFDSVNDPAIGEPVLTPTALDRRLGHTAEAICRYVRLPDVLGVVEVENLAVLTQLADRINAFGAAGSNGCALNPQYVAYLVEGNDVGGIDVGYLVSTREVRPGQPRVAVAEVTQFGLTTLFSNPNGGTELLNDRPPLLMRAVVHSADGSSEPVSIVINHLRSLGGASDTAAGSNGWATAGDRVRAKRGAQAQFLAQLVHDRQVADPQERIVLLGDFNVFEFNDGLVDGMGIITGRPAPAGQVLLPLASPVATPLTVMTPLSPRDQQYSFTFDGNAQSLDHAVVNQAVLDRLRDVRTDHARINADFAETRFGTGPLRTSDHDPVVLYLRVPGFRAIDLGVDVAAVAGSVAAGSPLAYTVDVVNRSVIAADDATLQLRLDRALPGTSVAAPPGWTCDAPVVGASTTTVACRATSLAASATGRFSVDAPTTVSIGRASVQLEATAGSGNRETGGGDNTDADVVSTTSNTTPGARDDAYSLTVDTELFAPAPGVLTNDVDADGDALTARIIDAPASGTAVLSADGALRYRPEAGFTGEDVLVYEACDAGNACTTATVRLAVGVVEVVRFGTRDDRFVLAENAPAQRLDVVANDFIEATRRALGRLSIALAPSAGTARVDDAGTPDDASDDTIVYTANADRSGDDVFTYRLCEAGISLRCGESVVQVVVRPVVDAATRFEIEGNGGFRDVPVEGYRAMADARLAATPLVAPRVDERPLDVDPTPEDVFDADGRQLLLGELSPGPVWRVLVDAESLSGGDIDLYIGVDLDGDGQPDRGELRCTAAMSAGAERCELAPAPTSGAPLRYWVLAHNADKVAHTARIERFEVPLIGGDGTLAATGPAAAARSTAWPMRLGWREPRLLDGESRAGYVALRASEGGAPAWMPVRLDRRGGESTALPLASGRPQVLRLAPGERQTRLFIDVPPGQSRLALAIDSDAALALDVRRSAAPAPDAAPPYVAPGTAGTRVTATGTGPGERQFSFDAPAAGRWSVVLTNEGTQPATARVRAELTGTAPVVRPGSYFNPGRSGHGLFVYPAAREWAGLWFTYGQDGLPTWYYLQDAAPGSNGVWGARLYRSAWNGRRNTLTEVGGVVLTPTGPDAFTFTHTVDGETGSEAMVGFGRGCPSIGATPVDASGLWFNPARAGSGYSVQLFPDYEFHAVFAYDDAGVPRFAVAERRGIGGAEARLDLEQTRGFCPLCVRPSAPQRTIVGGFRRVLGASGLQRVVVDARWADGVPGGWSADEAVQPLGLTQGCALP